MNIPAVPFYFIRHGETDWNFSNRIMGHTDIPLNERGIAQAHQARILLKSIKFEKIWSSPLQRARQTAEIINKDLGISIGIIDSLKERGWGSREGHLSHDLLYNSTKELPIGAESEKEFEERIISAFREVLLHRSQTPLIVAHGGVFKVLITLLTKSSFSAENCALYSFKPPSHPSLPWFIEKLNR